MNFTLSVILFYGIFFTLHPCKVHIWAGIGWQGSTAVCIFEKMNAALFVQILDRTLLHFIRDRLPDHHKYMQDNDLKHTSRLAQFFLADNDVNWWKTPLNHPT